MDRCVWCFELSGMRHYSLAKLHRCNFKWWLINQSHLLMWPSPLRSDVVLIQENFWHPTQDSRVNSIWTCYRLVCNQTVWHSKGSCCLSVAFSSPSQWLAAVVMSLHNSKRVYLSAWDTRLHLIRCLPWWLLVYNRVICGTVRLIVDIDVCGP